MGWRQGLRLIAELQLFFIFLQAQVGCSTALINSEGLALLELSARVEADPHGAFQDWDPMDSNPCSWSGVRCSDGKVEILNLTGLELAGTLAPEIGSLQRLKSLSLNDNRFQEDVASLDDKDIAADGAGCLSRKIGSGFKDWILLSGLGEKYGNNIPSFSEVHIMQNSQAFATALQRRFLLEAGNLPALSGNDAKPFDTANSKETQGPVDVISLGTGSFPAFSNEYGQMLMPLLPEAIEATTMQALSAEGAQSNDEKLSGANYNKWLYLIIIPAAILLTLVCALILVWRKPGRAPIAPWKTGLSGPLQKALVTGVPRLKRVELVAACEEFSNIINTYPTCTAFKGILSSGVEIAVVSTVISSSKDWPKNSETCFRKKIDALSRINHKNFINFLGYCVESEPFTRMMVFEFAPNGSLSQHLHIKEFEHLDWPARMRIIMGIAYCLQYTHHELDPPVAINDVCSETVYMTDDYAAKMADASIWKEVANKAKTAKEDSSSRSEAPPDLVSNVYCFGALLIEIISGKLPEQDDPESLCNWASEYLKDKSYAKLLDDSLKDHNSTELEAVCEVMLECIDPDPTQRPAMRDVVGKLRPALNITPEAAAPRLSPLWWAELELLSVKAS
ncbi:hypothetical protein PR202_gb27069 [Eleusine coracana subsp. coracana]|uniref:Protein kinase domain-containing protein n=1 Tax=Eleusine coracana subsp. coracana TaxID=191504 RepID=A0AAV5FTK6_ELECO|nr:hypothetical protein PR202_gb27069 [Eleusine coracana subsp. coracana]